MEGKMCALIRQTWFETAQTHLTDMERLAFYEACFRYEFTGELPTKDTCKYGSVLLLFDMVKADLKADREKADRIAERNRINGQQGGRPRNDNKRPQGEENPQEPKETQTNPLGNMSFDNNNTTLHNTTTAASSIEGGGGDLELFETQIWPRLNRSGKFNTRHRICVAKWQEYSDRKRRAIVKAVLSDMFAGADNPYYYLEDFAEPSPHWLTGKECEDEWREGRSVWLYNDGRQWQKVTAADVREFNLSPVKEMPPAV